MEKYLELEHLVNEMPSISLDEMSAIRLMNRMDTKFLTNVPTLKLLLESAKDSYFSQENNGHRIAPYATTYFDTPDGHEMFRTHHCGRMPRTKIRVRSYLDSDQTFLEVKRKNNHGKTKKKRVAVGSLESVIQHREGEAFLTERSGYTWDDLIPTLSNRFRRITLVNKAKTERLTIDFDLHFHNQETGRHAEMTDVVIIELKRDGRVPSPIIPLIRDLRIKPSGFSKYCIGTVLTHPELPKNRFKKRLVRIGKVTQKGCASMNE